MRIIIGDEIIIYLSKPYIKNVNLKDKLVAENFINKIKNKHKIQLFGYIDVKIYIDKLYGVVISIKKENLDYLDYFTDDISMNIEMIENTFLYKVDDIYLNKEILKYSEIYKYNKSLYLKIDKLSNIEIGKLIENSNIIYDNNAKEIIKKGKILKKEVITWKNL